MMVSPGVTTLANCVNSQLVHVASLRRANVDAFELVFRRDLAFGELGDLGADVARLLRDFAPCVLVDVDDLQLNLDDLAASGSFGGNELATPTMEPRRVTLERDDSRDELLFPEIEHAI